MVLPANLNLALGTRKNGSIVKRVAGSQEKQGKTCSTDITSAVHLVGWNAHIYYIRCRNAERVSVSEPSELVRKSSTVTRDMYICIFR
jgi:hypothetical protein